MCENYCSDNLPLHFDHFLLDERVSPPKIYSPALSPIQEIQNKFKQYEDFVKFGHVNAVTVPGNKDEIHRTLDEIGFDIFAKRIYIEIPQNARLKFLIIDFFTKTGSGIEGAAEYIVKMNSKLNIYLLITIMKNLKFALSR